MLTTPVRSTNGIVAAMLAGTVLSGGALFWHGQASLPVLCAGVLLFGLILRAHRLPWKGFGLLALWQTVMIALLYLLRYGTGALPDGLLVAGRMLLLILPGVLVMRATNHGDMARLLVRVLPERMGFVLSTCVFFFPTLWAVTVQTYEAQVLSGARILPRELLNPLHWALAVRLICLPAIMTSLTLSRDIALAAHCRWYGLHPHRTRWPGPTSSSQHGDPHA